MRIAIAATALMIFAVVLAGRAAEQTATVRGYVLDSACAFTKSLDKPVSRACALACAKGGSPLVILGDDGNIYWPISSATPAAGQNPRLLKFAGERVTASGKIFQRGGSRAIYENFCVVYFRFAAADQSRLAAEQGHRRYREGCCRFGAAMAQGAADEQP
jgi:hypothetical protein